MDNISVQLCDCESEYQDKLYGKKMRLHNISQKGKNKGLCICTVCGPSRRRNKYDKNLDPKDYKQFGMLYPIQGIGIRNYKVVIR